MPGHGSWNERQSRCAYCELLQNIITSKKKGDKHHPWSILARRIEPESGKALDRAFSVRQTKERGTCSTPQEWSKSNFKCGTFYGTTWHMFFKSKAWEVKRWGWGTERLFCLDPWQPNQREGSVWTWFKQSKWKQRHLEAERGRTSSNSWIWTVH